MDEKMEIMNVEPEVTPIKCDSTLTKVAPVAAGVGIGLVGGFLLSHFVVKPILAKAKAKKMAQAAPAEAPKAEEKKAES
jgi:hypothetical protein